MGRENPDPASRDGAGAGAKSSPSPETRLPAEKTARIKTVTRKALEMKTLAIEENGLEN